MEFTEEDIRRICKEEIVKYMAQRAALQLAVMDNRTNDALSILNSMNRGRIS
jgi:hypothetical protein